MRVVPRLRTSPSTSILPEGVINEHSSKFVLAYADLPSKL